PGWESRGSPARSATAPAATTQPTGSATPADIDRNGRPTSIGMGGRHHAGITGRFRRNAQPIPELRFGPGFDVAKLVTMRHQGFACARLSSPYMTWSLPRLFP